MILIVKGKFTMFNEYDKSVIRQYIHEAFVFYNPLPLSEGELREYVFNRNPIFPKNHLSQYIKNWLKYHVKTQELHKQKLGQITLVSGENFFNKG